MQNYFLCEISDTHLIYTIFMPPRFVTSCISVGCSINSSEFFPISNTALSKNISIFGMGHVASTNFEAAIFKAACFLSY